MAAAGKSSQVSGGGRGGGRGGGGCDGGGSSSKRKWEGKVEENKPKRQRECYNCDSPSHLARACPKPKKS